MKPWILYLIAGLIAYGSLYPFNLTVPIAHGEAWSKLFSDWSLLFSRMDALGNLLLFIPFGLVGFLGIAARSNALTRIALVMLWGLGLALVLQMAQIYVPQRTPTLSDVLWNMVGLCVGIGTALNLRWSFERLPANAMLPSSLVVLWLAAELLPFVPSLDVQSIKDNLKGLRDLPWATDQLLFHAAGVLLAGRALAAVVGEGRSVLGLLFLTGVVAAGKVLVVSQTLSVAVLAGLAIGFIAWCAICRWREPGRATLVLIMLFCAYVFGALSPFDFRTQAESFGWLPFAGLLRGSMVVNIQGIAANLCLYAGMLWAISTLGGSIAVSSVLLAGVVLMVESIQIFAVGRSAEITEPILVLVLGQLLRAVSPAAPERGGAAHTCMPSARMKPSIPRHAPERAHKSAHGSTEPPRDTASAVAFSWRRWALTLGAICVSMALAFYVVLRLPRIPYNLRELFLWDGAFPFLVIFALSLLWVGAASNLLSHYVAMSRRPWLTLPLLAFGASLVSLLLMYASVTDESIGDIAGSSNVHWHVVNQDMWGVWVRSVFVHIPADIVAFFERPIRYGALLGPVVTFLGLMLLAVKVLSSPRYRVRGVVLFLVSVFLWLWLCKGIAFDWASTDNLNELVAHDGPAGWGGGGYLYLLLAMICANAVLLTHLRVAWISAIIASLVTVALVPLGWWLLNEGLEPYVVKYSQTFSGVQFLLGPDRKNLLSSEMLFMRWSAVQVAGVLVLAAGARLVQPVIDSLIARWRPPAGHSSRSN